jgi:hypothetical protein
VVTERRYQFGELSPEEFEAGMQRRIRVRDMNVGQECILRVNSPTGSTYTYISDYPVLIEGLREEDSSTIVSLIHLAPRDTSWDPEPKELAFTPRGYIQLKNTGRNRRTDLPTGNITVGYLLPAEAETPEEYIERLARAIETLPPDEKTILIGRLAAYQTQIT